MCAHVMCPRQEPRLSLSLLDIITEPWVSSFPSPFDPATGIQTKIQRIFKELSHRKARDRPVGRVSHALSGVSSAAGGAVPPSSSPVIPPALVRAAIPPAATSVPSPRDPRGRINMPSVVFMCVHVYKWCGRRRNRYRLGNEHREVVFGIGFRRSAVADGELRPPESIARTRQIVGPLGSARSANRQSAWCRQSSANR